MVEITPSEAESSVKSVVEIYRARDVVDAHIIKAALAAAGISSRISGENVAAAEPNLCWANPCVVADSADAPKAARLLSDIQESRGKHPTTAPLGDSEQHPTANEQNSGAAVRGLFSSRQHLAAVFVLGTLVLGLLFKILYRH